jgi:hypothetical protein
MATRVTICKVLPEPVGCSTRTWPSDRHIGNQPGLVRTESLAKRGRHGDASRQPEQKYITSTEGQMEAVAVKNSQARALLGNE